MTTNEHPQEHFGRSRQMPRLGGGASTNTAQVWILPPKLNPRVRDYFDEGKSVNDSPWLAKSEIPTSEELLDLDTSSQSSSDIVELGANRPYGAWESKEEYLSVQYELYREDAVRGIRECVARLRLTPDAVESAFNGKVGIYEKVHICAIGLSTRGIANRVTFSLRRVGKQIIWEQSQRLVSGSLVVLSPKHDKFRSKAIVAVVAARPLEGVQMNPPEVDLFIPRTEELEIDPATEYIMIEDRGSLFEANRHTLLALQRMIREPFPLAEHIVEARRDVLPPKYIKTHPKLNMSAIFRGNTHETFQNVDILHNWPEQPESNLDASQLKALRRILTKQLAIIQGPPGTGKTHVSIEAVRVMLENHRDGDAPILIACQTNHAIDQFLRHIAEFETKFVRLGGQSKDRDVIKKHTLFEVRRDMSGNTPAGCMFGMAKKKMANMHKELALLLSPLQPNKAPLDHRVLENFKLLTKAQADSLETGATQWVQDKSAVGSEARMPFAVWLAQKLVSVPPKQQPENFGFDFEEVDLEFEQLKELEAENPAKDDEDFESLRGPVLAVADNHTCCDTLGMLTKAKDLLRQQDMWEIPEASRAAVYVFLQTELKRLVTAAFRVVAKQYNEEARKRRIGGWEADENIIKQQKIIGMTTTGLSKYRGLLSALLPRVVLIEEAAETLEPPIAVACMPSVQHLILVGDHRQLRPHTQVSSHEDEPWYLNVSLFERMVNNKVEFDSLHRQRRMKPEIRRLLRPIYGSQIEDHPSVANPEHRPDVPGMGGVNSWFFTHQWSEQRDELMSCFNATEVEMIVGFVEYLVYNGMETADITILTFYNGQRKRLLSELRARVSLQGRRFNVVTVDSYQGEENKVVILSLVRSNNSLRMGFLGVDNRVCVALSRAQCGFYIFGNGLLLHTAEAQLSAYSKGKKTKVIDRFGKDVYQPAKKAKNRTWTKVIEIMAGKGRHSSENPTIEPKRVSQDFPIRCSQHGEVSHITNPEDWESIVGGCQKECLGKLPCGHPCTLTCHPFPHEMVNCDKCQVIEPGEPDTKLLIKDRSNGTEFALQPSSTSNPDTGVWKTFANEEYEHSQKRMLDYVSASSIQRVQGDLIDLDIDGSSPSLLASTSPIKITDLCAGRKSYKEVYRIADGQGPRREESLINLLD